MVMTESTSQAIAAHGYDPATKTARIEFINGRVYDYPDVAPERYKQLSGAESLGRHFNAHWRGFAHVRVA
jgi:hypothetical protein